ncbi:MAG TPA: hypothetical protein PKV50_03290 [Prolixibacteraceae bacterium]|nr:MAG: hypothetical protein BWX77_00011 [Bacteroidetes bacterium ADurb.Bin090]HUM88529.1 hypothetical protein [Prolixibacteraceae bacterium]
MKTYRTIEEYISDAENIFVNMEWRQFAAKIENECLISKGEWQRTLETLGKLLENMEWARGIIRSMLQSPISSEVEQAKKFIKEVSYYRELSHFGVEFFSFFSDWQKFFSVVGERQEVREKPLPMKIIPDAKKVVVVDGVIPTDRKKQIWQVFSDNGFLGGDVAAFSQLADGEEPTGVLKWNAKHKGNFSGVTLVHFLKRLGVDFGDKNKNIRTAICFFEGVQVERVNSYLQNYEQAKLKSETIREIDKLFDSLG